MGHYFWSATGIDLRLQGKFFETFNPMSGHFEDFTFDFEYANWGFKMEVLCNYPEARLEGSVTMKNHTIYASERRKSNYVNSYVSYSAPQDLHMSQHHNTAPTDLILDRSAYRIRLISSCVADTNAP